MNPPAAFLPHLVPTPLAHDAVVAAGYLTAFEATPGEVRGWQLGAGVWATLTAGSLRYFHTPALDGVPVAGATLRTGEGSWRETHPADNHVILFVGGRAPEAASAQ